MWGKIKQIMEPAGMEEILLSLGDTI